MESNNTPGRSGSNRGTVRALIAISAYTVIAAGALWWFDGAPPAARIPVALPLLLFAPGYAVVSALFPSADAFSSRLERAVLAVVASIAVVPMVVLASTALGSIDMRLVLGGIAGITVVAAAVAILRALTGDAEARPSEQYREASGDGPDVRHLATDGVTILAITVTALLLIASGAVAYAGNSTNGTLVHTGDSSDQLMTEFYLVDESGTEADSLNGNELRINHHGDKAQRYTVVVLLDPPSESEQAATELDRSSTVVEPDETAAVTYDISRSEIEADSTIRFLLFTGTAPSTPDPDSAHRTLKLSVEETVESENTPDQ